MNSGKGEPISSALVAFADLPRNAGLLTEVSQARYLAAFRTLGRGVRSSGMAITRLDKQCEQDEPRGAAHLRCMCRYRYCGLRTLPQLMARMAVGARVLTLGLPGRFLNAASYLFVLAAPPRRLGWTPERREDTRDNHRILPAQAVFKPPL